jgi:hypothetical protein
MRALWIGTRNLIRSEIHYFVTITSKSFQLYTWCVWKSAPVNRTWSTCTTRRSEEMQHRHTDQIAVIFNFCQLNPKLFTFSLGEGRGEVQ